MLTVLVAMSYGGLCQGCMRRASSLVKLLFLQPFNEELNLEINRAHQTHTRVISGMKTESVYRYAQILTRS